MSTIDHTFDPGAAAGTDSGIFGLPDRPEDAAVVLVPVPFDATTSYRPGTADGPRAILAASHQIDLHDHETGEPWSSGIAMLAEPTEVRAWSVAARAAAEPVMHDPDCGDAAQRIAEVDAICERLNRHLETEVSRWLEAGKVVGTVGGDHGTTFGAIAAHARRHPGLGVLHIDAHADLRAAYQGFAWSHASIMENVVRRVPEVGRLVQVGVRDFCTEEVERIEASGGRIRTWFDADLARERFEGATWGAQVTAIVDALPREVYVSFDIDGLSPDLCPHTGTPVPGGLGFNEASHLIGAVARSGRRIVGFELVEVAPGPDGDEWDANVGARMLYKLIGWALRSRAPAG
ncbi:MAG: agmatinase family protein [Ectothiorhodospiraceae bacterium]|nr:agmatinase family protein [Ectothiorhodospiraceae bacterium]